MTSPIPMPAALVSSTITHIRHQPVVHRLEKKGLSIWLDLDRLDAADKQSVLFSVGRWNLLSFDEGDHGANFLKKEKKPESLADYARQLAQKFCPGVAIDSVTLLTFPRILGQVFNPISVYRCCDNKGTVILTIYEVRNTFGDMHSYVGLGDGVHEAEKIFHVSPFFPVSGGYRLKMREMGASLAVVMDYIDGGKHMLTATMRGEFTPLNSANIMKNLIKMRQFPSKPIIQIHAEAVRLWLKSVPFFPRPEPPRVAFSLAKNKGDNQ